MQAVLDDEIQFPVFLRIKKVQGKSGAFDLLGDDVFQNAAHVDFQIALQNGELDVLHAGGAQQPHVTHEQLEQAVLFIQRQRGLGLGHVVTGQGHPGLGQPLEAVGIPQLPPVGVHVGEDEPAVLGVELGGDAVKDGPDFQLVVPLGVLGDVQPVQLQDVGLQRRHLGDVVGVHIELDGLRHPAHHDIAEKQLFHRLMDGLGHRR